MLLKFWKTVNKVIFSHFIEIVQDKLNERTRTRISIGVGVGVGVTIETQWKRVYMTVLVITSVLTMCLDWQANRFIGSEADLVKITAKKNSISLVKVSKV